MFLFTWQIIYNYITHYYISLAIRGCLACHFETVHTLISEWNLRLFWQYSRRLYFNVFACNVIDHARIHILQSCFIMFSTTFSNRLKKIVLILLRNGQHCTNFNGDSDMGIDGTVLCPSALRPEFAFSNSTIWLRGIFHLTIRINQFYLRLSAYNSKEIKREISTENFFL